MSRAEAFAEIAVVLGSRFSLLMADRDQHSHSEAWFPPALPEAVAFPECTDEVAAILAICSRHQCPVVAWGRELRWKAMRWQLRAGWWSTCPG